MNTNMQSAHEFLSQSPLTMVLTGAGVSADSGIPTFRGAGGYWRNKHFSELACMEGFIANPREVWDWYLERRRTCKRAVPNAAHVAIARWMENHPTLLVTQNVDGLHERAKSPIVIRLHGSLWQSRCIGCDRTRTDEALEHVFDEIPTCSKCRKMERPGVVWFGENMPVKETASANLASRRCDALLVIGTSATVWPAAGFIDQARDHGAKIIEINTEPALVQADWTFAGRASEVIPELLQEVR